MFVNILQLNRDICLAVKRKYFASGCNILQELPRRVFFEGCTDENYLVEPKWLPVGYFARLHATICQCGACGNLRRRLRSTASLILVEKLL